MATWDFWNTSTTQVGSPVRGPSVWTIQATLDLTDAGGMGYGNTLASADVVRLAVLPPGCVVLSAGMRVTTVADTSVTIALGDSGSSTRYNAATAATSTGYTISVSPHAYTSQDYLLATIGGASMTKGVVKFWAIVANLDDARPAALPGAL